MSPDSDPLRITVFAARHGGFVDSSREEPAAGSEARAPFLAAPPRYSLMFGRLACDQSLSLAEVSHDRDLRNGETSRDSNVGMLTHSATSTQPSPTKVPGCVRYLDAGLIVPNE